MWSGAEMVWIAYELKEVKGETAQIPSSHRGIQRRSPRPASDKGEMALDC